MPDEIDRSQEQQLQELERRIAAARGGPMPGQPGECDHCGQWHHRLVGHACPPCRDRHRLP